jgi:hypothetical protein
MALCNSNEAYQYTFTPSYFYIIFSEEITIGNGKTMIAKKVGAS